MLQDMLQMRGKAAFEFTLLSGQTLGSGYPFLKPSGMEFGKCQTAQGAILINSGLQSFWQP